MFLLVKPSKRSSLWPKTLGFCSSPQRTSPFTYWCVLRRVAGWVAGGCWDDYINSYCGSFPHSLRLARFFPTGKKHTLPKQPPNEVLKRNRSLPAGAPISIPWSEVYFRSVSIPWSEVYFRSVSSCNSMVFHDLFLPITTTGYTTLTQKPDKFDSPSFRVTSWWFCTLSRSDHLARQKPAALVNITMAGKLEVFTSLFTCLWYLDVLGAASQAVATGHLSFHGPIALIHIYNWKVPNSISVVSGLAATTYELGAHPIRATLPAYPIKSSCGNVSHS